MIPAVDTPVYLSPTTSCRHTSLPFPIHQLSTCWFTFPHTPAINMLVYLSPNTSCHHAGLPFPKHQLSTCQFTFPQTQAVNTLVYLSLNSCQYAVNSCQHACLPFPKHQRSTHWFTFPQTPEVNTLVCLSPNTRGQHAGLPSPKPSSSIQAVTYFLTLLSKLAHNYREGDKVPCHANENVS